MSDAPVLRCEQKGKPFIKVAVYTSGSTLPDTFSVTACNLPVLRPYHEHASFVMRHLHCSRLSHNQQTGNIRLHIPEAFPLQSQRPVCPTRVGRKEEEASYKS